MKKSIKVDQKKKRGRPATGRDPMVSSRIPASTVSAIDEWATHNSTTRSDAIRRLVELGLTVRVKRGQAPAQRDHRAKELASKAIDKLVIKAPEAEKAIRKRQLLKGPKEFRENRVDLPKAKIP
jgi:hypothetical protein